MLQTKKEIKDYLDNCIRFWRKEREKNVPNAHEMTYDSSLCNHYIDAFQSIRMSIFDELLPKE